MDRSFRACAGGPEHAQHESAESSPKQSEGVDVKARAMIARRIGIGLVAASAALITASCAAGQHAATAEEHPSMDGTSGQVGNMQLHALAIKSPSGPCVLPGGDAALTLILVNTGHKADSLQSVTSPRFSSSAAVASAADLAEYAKVDAGTGACTDASGAASAPTTPSDTSSLPAGAGAQTVAPGRSLQLGVYNANGNDPGVPTEPIILLRGLQDGPLFPGESVPVTFTFARAGDVTLQVPVQLSVAPHNSIVPSVTNETTEAVN
jgi:copper(I)-binding protein